MSKLLAERFGNNFHCRVKSSESNVIIPANPSIKDKLKAGTFVMINDMYVRDDKNIYMYDLYLEGADVKTFSILNGLVSKDKNAVYYYGKK